jgi:hypothetical protein
MSERPLMPLITRLLLSIFCIASCLALPLTAAGGSCSTIELAMLLESQHGRLVKIASLLFHWNARNYCRVAIRGKQNFRTATKASFFDARDNLVISASRSLRASRGNRPDLHSMLHFSLHKASDPLARTHLMLCLGRRDGSKSQSHVSRSCKIAADSRRNCVHVCELVGAGAPLTPREA